MPNMPSFATRSTAYIALSQEEKPGRYSNFEIRAAAGQPASLIPALKSAIAEVNPDVALQFTRLATQVDEFINRERLLADALRILRRASASTRTIGLKRLDVVAVAMKSESGWRFGAEQSRVLLMVLGEVAFSSPPVWISARQPISPGT
jgi:hypothetical protein